MVTTVREQLEAHQAKLLTKISAAAKAADTHTLLSLNDDLRRTASLLGRMDDIGVEARAILGHAPSAPGKLASPTEQKAVKERVAGRGHGVPIRADFLERAAKAGLALRPYRGAIYSSASGRRIGIAVATERKPDRWFLGLGEDDFDAAVLLCAPDSGKVIDLCLPQALIAQHKRFFSRSGGQVKFNVARRDGHTMLKIPSRQPERVDQFVGAITGLDR